MVKYKQEQNKQLKLTVMVGFYEPQELEPKPSDYIHHNQKKKRKITFLRTPSTTNNCTFWSSGFFCFYPGWYLDFVGLQHTDLALFFIHSVVHLQLCSEWLHYPFFDKYILSGRWLYLNIYVLVESNHKLQLYCSTKSLLRLTLKNQIFRTSVLDIFLVQYVIMWAKSM